MKYIQTYETQSPVLKLMYVEYNYANGSGRSFKDFVNNDNGRSQKINVVGRWCRMPDAVKVMSEDKLIAIAVVERYPFVLNRYRWSGYIVSPIEAQGKYEFMGQPNEKWGNWDNPDAYQIRQYKKLMAVSRFDL